MSNIFRLVFLIVGCIYWVKSDRQLTADDESWDNQKPFLTALLDYSGLSKNVKTVTVCEIDCSINPSGSFIWDVRSQLYEKNLMQTDPNTSIDGCLKANSHDNKTYNECMVTVRKNMMTYLNEKFFKTFIEKFDCNNNTLIEKQISENCKQI